jgi:hypothetical protein
VIHYHGTPIGGGRVDVVKFLKGRHALVPWARADDLAAVMECCSDFILDNSAYTFWKKGKAVQNWSDYYLWVRSIKQHPGFRWALIPDVIDGDEAENDALLEEWPDDLCGVPVWHLHETTARLRRLSRRFGTVALGSSGKWSHPGSRAWWSRMDEAIPHCCDEDLKPVCKLHGLRMLSPAITSRLPLSSADSTNASVNSGAVDRFGMYPPLQRWQRAAAVIADRVEATNSPSFYTPSFMR